MVKSEEQKIPGADEEKDSDRVLVKGSQNLTHLKK